MKTLAIAALLGAFVTTASPALAQTQTQIQTQMQTRPHAVLYKNPSCGCCEGHAEHLRANGFEVEEKVTHDLALIRQQHGVPPEFEGCHTILVDGYVVEGHVSADTIKRLLTERPQGVTGIAMPGMPTGVPGMPGPKEGPIDIYAFGGHGDPTVFTRE